MSESDVALLMDATLSEYAMLSSAPNECDIWNHLERALSAFGGGCEAHRHGVWRKLLTKS